MMPYNVQLVHKFNPHEHPLHFRFAMWANEDVVVTKKQKIKNKIIFSDEAYFHRDDCIIRKPDVFGTQKTHTWSYRGKAAITSDCLVRLMKQRHYWSMETPMAP